MPGEFVARIKLYRHFVALLGQRVELALAVESAQMVGEPVEEMKVAIVDVALQRHVEQRAGLLVGFFVDRLQAFLGQLSRGRRQLVARNGIRQLGRRTVHRRRPIAIVGFAAPAPRQRAATAECQQRRQGHDREDAHQLPTLFG